MPYTPVMAPPLIGLTTRTIAADGPLSVMRSQAVGEGYVNAIRWAGGLSVGVPSNLGAAGVLAIAERLDGIVLTGGTDVDPVHFGEGPQPGLGVIEPTRDQAEIALCRYALTNHLPVLAVCRGLQVLNVAFGGGVIQDLGGAEAGYLCHDLKTWEEGPGHSVDIVPDTKLAGIVNATRLRVNSNHHQAVGDVAPELVVSARAPDGVVEGLEHPESGFMIGVEWHPERSYLHAPDAGALLMAFVSACEA
jgi:putative glutamine amidotransferase